MIHKFNVLIFQGSEIARKLGILFPMELTRLAWGGSWNTWLSYSVLLKEAILGDSNFTANDEISDNLPYIYRFIHSPLGR